MENVKITRAIVTPPYTYLHIQYISINNNNKNCKRKYLESHFTHRYIQMCEFCQT